MKINPASAWALVLLLAGCATDPAKEHQVVTEIVSEPPGARIEVNGNYVGDAPVTVRLRHHPADRVVMGRVVIRATPRGNEGHVQEKVFQGPAYPFDPHRDVVPERVLFVMDLKPADPKPGTSAP